MSHENTCENVIEWLRGDDEAYVTAPSSTRLKGQMMRLAEKYPDEVEILHENEDGSIYGKVPVRYISVRHPKVISESHKETLIKNFARNRDGDDMDGV